MTAAREIAADLAYLRISIANVYFAGNRQGWVLIDTGVGGHATAVIQAAAARFGENSRPNAIILTHGHFDHAGNALELARHWNVPVYAHRSEEHTSELQSHVNLVCRLLLEKKKQK